MADTFHAKLRRSWRRSDSALCVGLDPRADRLPPRCRRHPQPLWAFCQQIFLATAPYACAFKIQFACFAAERAEDQLESLIGFMHHNHPDIPVVLDAKRGDIGATSELYAREAFRGYRANAVTVNPYLGWDAIAPFARQRTRGVFVLCHTSNPDSAWLQDHPADDPAYLRVAELAAQRDRGNLGLVVGATFPEQLAAVRERAPKLPLLVPGVGPQGGNDLDAVFVGGMDRNGAGLLVSASRSIIFAEEGDNWAHAAEQAASKLRDDMRRARDAALAGRR